MHNTHAFLNAIIIASSVLSCVWSLPTQPIESALEIFSSTPEPSPTCFEPYPYPSKGEVRSIYEYAVDSEGRPCFESYKDSGIYRLVDKTNFTSNYANVTAENCPPWSQMKQCFLDHVNSHKCNEEDRQHVVDSEFVNVRLVFGDLLCNPERSQYFRNLWENMLKEGFWECFYSGENFHLMVECNELIQQNLNAQGRHGHYQDVGLFFDCMKPGARKCAKGDHVYEIKLIELLEEFDRTLQGTHRAIWNH